MFKSSWINLAKANIATNCAHDERLSDPFFASLLSGVIIVGGSGVVFVGRFGRYTFVDS